MGTLLRHERHTTRQKSKTRNSSNSRRTTLTTTSTPLPHPDACHARGLPHEDHRRRQQVTARTHDERNLDRRRRHQSPTRFRIQPSLEPTSPAQIDDHYCAEMIHIIEHEEATMKLEARARSFTNKVGSDSHRFNSERNYDAAPADFEIGVCNG